MTDISTSASAAEQAARAFAARCHGAFIDGVFDAAGGEPPAVENPATEERSSLRPRPRSSTARSQARPGRSPTAAGRG